jgi:hypothetical protein
VWTKDSGACLTPGVGGLKSDWIGSGAWTKDRLVLVGLRQEGGLKPDWTGDTLLVIGAWWR